MVFCFILTSVVSSNQNVACLDRHSLSRSDGRWKYPASARRAQSAMPADAETAEMMGRPAAKVVRRVDRSCDVGHHDRRVRNMW